MSEGKARLVHGNWLAKGSKQKVGIRWTPYIVWFEMAERSRSQKSIPEPRLLRTVSILPAPQIDTRGLRGGVPRLSP